MIAMNVYLLKKRLVLQYRDGTNVFAPVGMEARIISVSGKYPRVILAATHSFPEGRHAYEIKWSDLSLEQPCCSKCKHPTDPQELVAVYPKS